MSVLYIVNIIFVCIFIGFLVFPFVINVINLTALKRIVPSYNADEKDIACVITAYKNIDLALLAAESLLANHYKNFHIYIVADECEIPEIVLSNTKLTILKPTTKLGSKVRSIHFAINNFVRNHYAVAIFDPDNLADKEFLKECNGFLKSGYKAVQGKRVAKNLDTNIACLDAMGEIYYNYITKEIPFKLGSSSIIAGSGMVIETSLFENFFNVPYIKKNFNLVIPGEDKILHYYIVSAGEIIAYAQHAIVYDEKIEDAEMIKSQRARWMNSYILNLSNAFSLIANGAIHLNFNKFFSGILTLYPPLFLLILTSIILTGVNLFISMSNAIALVIAVFIFVLNFLLVIKLNKAHPKIWKAIWRMPYFMFNQIIALFNIGKSNKDFLTTQNKKKISLEEVIKDI